MSFPLGWAPVHDEFPMSLPTLNIVGCGRLGRSLGRLWNDSGVFQLQDLHNRGAAGADAARAFIGAGAVVAQMAELRPAQAWLIATPDAAIAPTAAALASARVVPAGACVFHSSGARSSALLAPLAAAGAVLASAHPAMSFATPQRAIAAFAGCYCGIEGDAAARQLLEPAFAAIGARCFMLEAEHKLLYHAGSVFASNFSVVLLDLALRAYRRAGLSDETGLGLLRPLVEGAVANALALGPAAALTGPAARGDHATDRDRAFGASRAGIGHDRAGLDGGRLHQHPHRARDIHDVLRFVGIFAEEFHDQHGQGLAFNERHQMPGGGVDPRNAAQQQRHAQG